MNKKTESGIVFVMPGLDPVKYPIVKSLVCDCTFIDNTSHTMCDDCARKMHEND